MNGNNGVAFALIMLLIFVAALGLQRCTGRPSADSPVHPWADSRD